MSQDNDNMFQAKIVMMEGFEEAFVGAQLVYDGSGAFLARAIYDYEKCMAIMIAKKGLDLEGAQDELFSIVRDSFEDKTLPGFVTQNVEVLGELQ